MKAEKIQKYLSDELQNHLFLAICYVGLWMPKEYNYLNMNSLACLRIEHKLTQYQHFKIWLYFIYCTYTYQLNIKIFNLYSVYNEVFYFEFQSIYKGTSLLYCVD